MKIFRYEVPVDDDWHEIPMCGIPLHVGCRDPRYVEFWAAFSEGNPARSFTVIGPGHEADDNGTYRGTAVDPGLRLVWHLIEQAVPQ